MFMDKIGLIIAIVSIFASLVILKFSLKEYSNIANIYLSLFFFIMGLYGISHYIINYSNNINSIAYTLNIATPLFISIGPLIYLYTKKNIDDTVLEFKYTELIHFIPMIIILIDMSPHLLSSFQDKVEIVNNLVNNFQKYNGTKHLLFSDINSIIIRQLLNFIYILFSLYYLVTKKVNAPISVKHLKLMLLFLYLINISNLLFSFIILIYTGSFMHFDFFIISKNIANLIYITSWAVHGILLIILFFNPTILYNLPQKILSIHKNKLSTKKLYKTFELDDDYLDLLSNKLEEFIKNKPLDQNYTLSTLSIETKIPTHHLNYYFKEKLNTHFSTWRNKMKLKYAIQLIHDGSLNNFTIDAIATKSGFNTYSNFFTLFKEEFGVTPSEYIQKIKNEA
jgi:AraC-like DNA-binding protein